MTWTARDRDKEFTELGTLHPLKVDAANLIRRNRVSALRAESIECSLNFFEIDFRLAGIFRPWLGTVLAIPKHGVHRSSPAIRDFFRLRSLACLLDFLRVFLPPTLGALKMATAIHLNSPASSALLSILVLS